MIDLYVWSTPNGFKPLIMLEELAAPFTVHAVNLGEGAQHRPDFLQINPNGKIPALVDHDVSGGPVRVFESGAMLIYLGEKFGRFLPAGPGQARADVLAWLMFQMAGVGPMMGQLNHFQGAKRDDPYPLDRYRNEVERLMGVLNTQLAGRAYLAGDYSIADMATLPWVRGLPRYGMELKAYPNVAAWTTRLEARVPVQRALAWKPKLSAGKAS